MFIKNGMDKEKTIQECMEHIGDRIVILIDEKRLIKFYYRKITSQWEANSSYVLPYYYLVIPYSVVGWKWGVVKTVDKLINL